MDALNDAVRPSRPMVSLKNFEMTELSTSCLELFWARWSWRAVTRWEMDLNIS